MPEAGGSPAEDPAQPPDTRPCLPAAGLSRLELELPDGRYLLSYRHLEGAAGVDA